MAEGHGSFRGLLDEIFNPARNPPAARLVRLSNLSREELAVFGECWSLTDNSRRRELVAALAQLARDNVGINFDSIFRFSLSSDDVEV